MIDSKKGVQMGLFDPDAMETKEPVVGNDTPESAYVPDTNGDPEGSEARQVKAEISLPDWFYRKFALTNDGKATFNPAVVDGIMGIFDVKFGTPQTFTEFEGGPAQHEMELAWDHSINNIVDGIRELLTVDPQSTGLNVLQLTTRTWSEFCSVCYEYQDSLSNFKEEELPDWLLEREQKMYDLGRKARMLSSAIQLLDHEFGLKDTQIHANRVRNAVESRLQRLAEWNYNQQADASGKVKRKLNAEANAHMQSIVDNA